MCDIVLVERGTGEVATTPLFTSTFREQGYSGRTRPPSFGPWMSGLGDLAWNVIRTAGASF